ncbi:MAG: OmpA family protein [Acidobacteriota bacterium]|nr:OmpA family protein [Acidobacteriota bacterium]MDH3524777.1 OmpA family protein [Acidobacteriota bacterium]
MRRILRGVLPVLAIALIAGGCATKKYVQTEMETMEAEVGERMDGIETRVEENQSAIEENEERLAAASETARDAYDRAVAAGLLAEGKFLYETILSSDRFRFEVDRAELSDEARAALDEFAEQLKAENKNVFVEIQGHTDSTGSESYNLKLGEQRAEAVRRYLSERHGIALHRMSIISYGETAPISENDTREGRALNRRVSLVVLQ